MKATFKDRSIYLSNELAKEAKIRKGSQYLPFRYKGEVIPLGFHKGSKQIFDEGYCYRSEIHPQGSYILRQWLLLLI